jgi:hypothetical protein
LQVAAVAVVHSTAVAAVQAECLLLLLNQFLPQEL